MFSEKCCNEAREIGRETSRDAESKNFRYHARRHMAATLGWRDRQPFPNAVDDALYARWPSATRTGYVPPDEDAEDAEDPVQQETP